MLVVLSSAARVSAQDKGTVAPAKAFDVHVSKVKDLISKEADAAKQAGKYFKSLSEAELTVKLAASPTGPVITFMAWNTTTPGGNVDLTVGIYNSGATTSYDVYAHVFAGPANAVADPGLALATVDTRFPRLTQPAAFGLTLHPGESKVLQFQIAAPSGIDKSSYLGNVFLFQLPGFGVGTVLERSAFTFTVH
jgi:hypothetical protein